MAKKKATGPKRRRKKSAAKKKADRILTEDQVRDLQEKIRLGTDQALARVATPDLSMDFPVRGEANKQRKDGPDEIADVFWCNGHPHSLTPMIAEFLRLIWGKEPVPFIDLDPHVGDENEGPTSRYRINVLRLNKVMEDIGASYRWGTGRDMVIRKK